MIRQLQKSIETLLKLPPEPPAPYGDEKSLRVFRAAPNFFKYQLILWVIGQTVGALLFVFVFGIAMVAAIKEGGGTAGGAIATIIGMVVLMFALAQALFTYLTLRLHYEMRWYKVTDRSLRIREGVWFVREMTMTFANIQKMEISQGPIQRWLGIADLRVHTAGGGGAAASQTSGKEGQHVFNMHIGMFRGIDNAEEILRLMEERLRLSRSAGLGDTDDPETHHMIGDIPRETGSSSLLDAARGMLEEARALTATLR